MRPAFQHTRSKLSKLSASRDGGEGFGDGRDGVAPTGLQVTVSGKLVHRAHDRLKDPGFNKRLFIRAYNAYNTEQCVYAVRRNTS